eukprot:57503-Rhodomonas_salina.2
MHCEIKCKQPPSPYTLYQERGCLYLISPRTWNEGLQTEACATHPNVLSWQRLSQCQYRTSRGDIFVAA